MIPQELSQAWRLNRIKRPALCNAKRDFFKHRTLPAPCKKKQCTVTLTTTDCYFFDFPVQLWWQSGIIHRLFSVTWPGFKPTCQGTFTLMKCHSTRQWVPTSSGWGGGLCCIWPCTLTSPQGCSKKSLSLGGSIKNYINIHDVYQSKSRTSMSSTLLIPSLSAVFESVDLNVLTTLLFF